MRLHVTLEKAPEGVFVVQRVEIPGGISQGETVEEALAHIADAISLVLEVRRDEARKEVRARP